MIMNGVSWLEYENERCNMIKVWEWMVQHDWSMRMNGVTWIKYENEWCNMIGVWEWTMQHDCSMKIYLKKQLLLAVLDG